MKKTSLAVTIAIMGLLSSCKDSVPQLGGFWTYKGTNHYANSAKGSSTAGTLTATTSASTSIDSVVIYFPAFPPPAAGYSIITSPPPTNGQAYFYMWLSGKRYVPTGSSAHSATVIQSGSKVNVTIPTMEVYDPANPADSGLFSATILQSE